MVLGAELVFSFSFSLVLYIMEKGNEQYLFLYCILQVIPGLTWRIFLTEVMVKICSEFLFHGLSLAQRLLALRSATQSSQVQITMIHLCLLGLCSRSHYSAFDIYCRYFFPNFSLLLEGDICDSKNSHKLMHAQYLAKCLANIRCNIEVS